MSDETLLSPGQQIRPIMNAKAAKNLVEKLYGFKVTSSVKELNSYDDKNFFISTDAVQNDHVEKVWQHGYVLKISNSMDSKNPKFFEAQNDVMKYLSARGFVCPVPVPNLKGDCLSVEKIDYGEEKSGFHVVRLLTFVPGKILVQVPFTTDLFYSLGRFVARVDNALSTFEHEEINKRDFIWKLGNVHKIAPFIQLGIKEPALVELVTNVIAEYEREVVGAMATLPHGTLHGDVNEQNIIVKKIDGTGNYDIYGLIDYGDLQNSCYVFELAIAITYCMLTCEVIDPLLAAGHVVAGWLTERPLEYEEWRLIKLLVESRLCQSLVMGAYSHLHDPSNNYLLSSAPTGWTCLRKLRNKSSEILYSEWRKIVESYGDAKYSISFR